MPIGFWRLLVVGQRVVSEEVVALGAWELSRLRGGCSKVRKRLMGLQKLSLLEGRHGCLDPGDFRQDRV